MTRVKPTSKQKFKDPEGDIEIIVEEVNTEDHFAWRLRVDGTVSPWSSHYQGFVKFKGWYLATHYWNGVFPVMTPFRLENAKPATKMEPIQE